MAKFVFELEAALEQRERVERERQRAVAELDRRRIELEDQIRGMNARRVEAARALRDRLAPVPAGFADDPAGERQRVAVEAVRLDANAALHDGLKLRRAAVELSGVYQRLQAARHALLQAVVARKAVETLRARRLAAWIAGEKRREDRELDDLAVMRAGRVE